MHRLCAACCDEGGEDGARAAQAASTGSMPLQAGHAVLLACFLGPPAVLPRAQPDLALCPAPQQEYAEGPEPQRFRRDDDDDDDGQRAARAASAAGLAGPQREQVSYGDL